MNKTIIQNVGFYCGLALFVLLLIFTSAIFYDEVILTLQKETKTAVGYSFLHLSIFTAISILSIPISIIWVFFNSIILFKNSTRYVGTKHYERMKLLLIGFVVCLFYLIIPYDWKYLLLKSIKGF
jgi:hypothetical protein